MNIPGMKIEANEDGTLTLEQDWLGNVDRVAIHPIHIRLLAERTGLIAKSTCEKSKGEVQRENDRLKRNMLRLREHALALQADFAENADFDHADLTHEMNQINALVHLFDMAVDDFADHYDAHEPDAHAAVTGDRSPATPPAKRNPIAPPAGQLALEV